MSYRLRCGKFRRGLPVRNATMIIAVQQTNSCTFQPLSSFSN